MRPRMPLVLALLLAPGFACASPCKKAQDRSELRDFEMDHERCEGQARKLAGNIDVGDYVSCMRVRGWCEAPEESTERGSGHLRLTSCHASGRKGA